MGLPIFKEKGVRLEEGKILEQNRREILSNHEGEPPPYREEGESRPLKGEKGSVYSSVKKRLTGPQ